MILYDVVSGMVWYSVIVWYYVVWCVVVWYTIWDGMTY